MDPICETASTVSVTSLTNSAPTALSLQQPPTNPVACEFSNGQTSITCEPRSAMLTLCETVCRWFLQRLAFLRHEGVKHMHPSPCQPLCDVWSSRLLMLLLLLLSVAAPVQTNLALL